MQFLSSLWAAVSACLDRDADWTGDMDWQSSVTKRDGPYLFAQLEQ